MNSMNDSTKDSMNDSTEDAGKKSIRECLSGYTRMICLLGDPVRHSLSPLMHNTAFQHLGLDYVYLAFEVNEQNLQEAVQAMRTLDAAGFNLTMPNKQQVIPLLDELSPEARISGAVNTVKNDNGRLIGYNTDGMGFVLSLQEEGVGVKDKRFVLLGAGGASKSIAIQLALEGAAELVIFNRNPEPAEALCALIQKEVPGCAVFQYRYEDEQLKKALSAADVLVNTTNVGMGELEGQSLIQDGSLFHPGLTVADVIYFPLKTRLLQIAESAGCKTLNGVGMIIGQGVFGFRIWTGEEMPVEVVRKAVIG